MEMNDKSLTDAVLKVLSGVSRTTVNTWMTFSLNYNQGNTCSFWSALHSTAVPHIHTDLCSQSLFCQPTDSQQLVLSCKILSSAVIADMCLVTGINGQQPPAKAAKAVRLKNMKYTEKHLPEEQFLIMDGPLIPQMFSEMKNLCITLLNLGNPLKGLQCWWKHSDKSSTQSICIYYLLSLVFS